MIRILFISYFFPPMGGAGVQRSLKFVQYLPAEGFLPVVVTGPGLSNSRWTPADSTLLAGIPSHVFVHRTEGPIPASTGMLRGRLENWLGLRSAFSKWWTRSGIELASEAGGDTRLIFVTMSPFQSANVASAVSRRLGIPWVADLRDPWALDEMMIYPTGLHRRVELHKMEKLLSTAALIVMNTPEAVTALKSELPRLRDRTIVSVTNGFDQDDFAQPVEPRTDSKFRIAHSGYLHTDIGLRLRSRRFYSLLGGVRSDVDILTRSHAILLEATERWCTQRPEVRKDLEIVFAGKTSGEDQALAHQSKVSTLIRFTGYLSHAQSLELIRTADLLFLPMHNLPLGKRSRIVPGKTYEYMASGRPILAAVPDGDARDFLSQSGTSLICRPDDRTEMIRILDRVYTAWKSGQSITTPNELFIKQFERRYQARALAKALNLVILNEAAKFQRAPIHEA